MLCLWKASKLKMLSNRLLNEMTNRQRAIFLGTALRLMAALSTPLGRYAINAVKQDISLATVPLRKSTDRRGPRPPSSLLHKSHRLAPQQPSHRYSGRSSTQVRIPIGSLCGSTTFRIFSLSLYYDDPVYSLLGAFGGFSLNDIVSFSFLATSAS